MRHEFHNQDLGGLETAEPAQSGEERTMTKIRTVITLTLAVALAASAGAQAQEWKTTAAFYGWGTWIDGTGQFGPKTNQVDVSAGQVLDSLEFGAMGRVRTETDQWAVVFDGIYASLGGTKQGPPKTELDVNQYIFQLDGAYRFAPHVEALAGVRFVRFESTLDVGRAANPLPTLHLNGNASFWDPVVGLRTITPLSDKWRIQAQGDVGLGVDMRFTWQAMVNFGYQPGEKTSIWLGYRAIGMDFKNAGGNDRFSMDTTMHGPVLGLAYQF